MRASATCRSLASIVLVFAGSWLCAAKVSSDIRGGSGGPITPYDTSTVVLDEEIVTRMREFSSRNKYVLYIPGPGGDDLMQKTEAIGLAYVRSGQIEGEVEFAFLGTDELGNKLEVDFGEVKGFEVLGKDGDSLVLEIDQFPAITPEEILKEQPSYLELRAKYRKSVDLWLPARNKNGAKLYLVGTVDGSDPFPVVPIESIARGRTILLHDKRGAPEAFWWAIPSVCFDPAYPHRRAAVKERE